MNQYCQTTLPSPGETLEALGAIMTLAEESVSDNRRINGRKRVLLNCEVQPLGEDLSPIGDPIHAISQDASVSGFGFIVNEPIIAKIVRIVFPSSNSASPIFLNIRHQTRCGSFYVVGGEVAVNWDFE